MSGSRGDEIDPSALLVHTEDIVAVVDVGGGVRYANDATRRMLGWQAGDVASVFERVHPDDVAPLLGALGELVDDTGSPTAQRARVRHADGEWRWLEILAVNRLDDPAVGGIVLSCRDVTGHVESEAARARRREADELLATLAARFVAVTADDVDAVIDGVLGELAGFAGVERGWVSQLRGDELEITHDWWAEGLPGLSPDQRRLRMADHPGLIAAFARNDLVVLPSLDRLAAGPDRTLLESQRARSLVMAPLVVDGERRGLVGLQSVRSEHPWPDDVRHVLGAVAALLGATLRRVVAEAALATSEARFRALLAHTAEGVRLLDADMRTIWASPWAAMMHGTGHLVHDPDDRLAMVHPDDRDTVARARADVLARPGVPHVVRFRISTADRGWRHLEEVATNLLDDPTVGGVVVNTRDITERRRHEHELLAQARRDPLTGLPNRRLFHELLDSALERAREAHTDVGVVFIDLDRFKLVNDSLGHHVGDALLVEAAARLRDSVRSGDVVARLGGDEFVVMCEGLDAVDELAARVLAAFRLPFRIGAGEVYTTASVGVALARPDADRTELLRDADAAMYAAKARGRNRSAVFDGGLVEAARERLAIESGLRRALEHRELELHWQPIVADGRAPVGVEALLRWHHPERGLLAPESFLDVAEDTGLIIGIGGWAVREACERWAAITRAGEVPPLDLHVNLSVRQLVAPGTAELVAQVLRDTGLDPARLRFEITESALLAGHDAHVELGLIRALGVRLSLDDFGTGYSSLTRLRELDIDMIKIDRSFVAGVDDDPDDVAIVAAIVELARVMRLDVVAEGVETPRQAEALLALGCHRTQGFLHAPPLPLDAVRSWIAGRSGSVEPVPH